MRVLSAKKELSEFVSSCMKDSKSIGFVPTMGALHQGHLALIKRSEDENDVTIVSIFVNPLQFNNASDLAKYPRVIDEDLQILVGKGVAVVFTPTEKDLYPEEQLVSIDFGMLADRLEGKYRPGHFKGVGIVVAKLLHLVLPTRAYFGLKDLQQFILIKKMCEDLSFPCEIMGVETVREPSGLALSSRNRQLSNQGLETAVIIHQELLKLKLGIESKEDLNDLLKQARLNFQSSDGFELEYMEAVNPKNLLPVNNYKSLSELAICIAGYVEGVRLIDNLYLRLK